MTNDIHFRMVVKSTCLNNMYHYRYQRRTPNTTSLSRTGDPTVAPSKEVNFAKSLNSE